MIILLGKYWTKEKKNQTWMKDNIKYISGNGSVINVYDNKRFKVNKILILHENKQILFK